MTLDIDALAQKARPDGREPITNDEWEEYQKALDYETVVALLDRIVEQEKLLERAQEMIYNIAQGDPLP